MSRNKHIVLFLAILAFLAAILGVKNLQVNADTRAYFSPTNEHLLRLQNFEKTYNQNNNLLFIFDTSGKDVFNREILQAIEDLTTKAWQLPGAIQVDSLTNFPHAFSEGDDFFLQDLVDLTTDLPPKALDDIRVIALQEPFLVNRLVSEDGKAAAVNVNFLLPARGSSAVKEINNAAKELIQEIEATHPGVRILATGNVALMRAFSEAALNDVAQLLPLGLLIIIFLVLICLKSLWETFYITVHILFVAGTCVGLGGWVGMDIDQSTAITPVIVLTLCMASTIHVVTTAKRMFATGISKHEAISESLKRNLRPVFLTSLTTSIGFLALNFADAPPFHDLGNLVAAGVVINFFMTFMLLPALMSSLPLAPGSKGIMSATGAISRATQQHSRVFLFLGIAVLVVVSFGIHRISLDDDFIRYFGKEYEYRVASDFAEDHLTGLNIVEFSVPAQGSGGVYQPEYLNTLNRFTHWLKQQDNVVSATSIVDLTRKIDQALTSTQDDTWSIPDDSDLIAQYFLLYEMSLAVGKDITDQINIDRSSSRVNIVLRGAKSKQIRQIKTQAEDWLATNAPPYMMAQGTSINVLFAYLSTINIERMLKGTLLSFLAISLIVALAMRSVAYGLISLATNTLPAIVGFGIWGLLYGEVNLAAAVITAMTLGVVVDDTIHFLVNYQKHRQRGLDAPRAVSRVVETVGTALIITTLVLAIGFLLLTQSGFQVNQTLGIFTALILVIALLADLLVLPAALVKFDTKLHKPSPSQ